MTMGFLSAFVMMTVWTRSLAQLSGGQPSLSFVSSRDRKLRDDWDRIVVPHEGTYIVSVTVDPDLNNFAERHQVVRRNDQWIFNAYARTIMSNTAMALHLNANDVITATGGDVSAGATNRLSVAYTSLGGAFYSIASYSSVLIHAGQSIPFDKGWNSPGGGWTDRTQDYIQVTQQGVYWVMAKVSAQFYSLTKVAVTFLHPVTEHLYDVMTITTASGYPVSCSGAFLMLAGERVLLMGRATQPFRLNALSILSAVLLDENGQNAFAARPVLQSQSQCEAQGTGIRWGEFPHRAVITRRSTHSAHQGHQDNALKNLTQWAGHTRANATIATHASRTRRVPLDQDPRVLRLSSPIPTNYGNMGVAGDNHLTIQVTGSYVVGMRPENWAGDNQMGFLLYRNDHAIWATWSEGTGSGETFAWHFSQHDRLVLHIFGACRLQSDSLFSVALLTRG